MSGSMISILYVLIKHRHSLWTLTQEYFSDSNSGSNDRDVPVGVSDETNQQSDDDEKLQWVYRI